MDFLILILGFVLLIKGSDLFVDSSSSIARKFNVSNLMIGLTIVAIGTSLPEASVSITSALNGQNDISVANAIGSNLFNILGVLGCSSILTSLPVSKSSINKDLPFLILISVLLLILGKDCTLSRTDGLLLLVLFLYFFINTILCTHKEEHTSHDNSQKSSKSNNIFIIILLCIIGITCIIIGGNLIVDSASKIALKFGMSENLIGLTIIAVGTSLPEFVTSLVAVKKGQLELAIGNVVGSSIFNILFILGLSSAISPISVSILSKIDTIFMIFITILLFIIAKCKNKILKSHGYIFILFYISYMYYTIIR